MRVAIVGLGLAGLRTAMLLEQAGIGVLLFEARTQAGGRLRTVTDDGEPLYEAGGEWIDAEHHRMLSLLAAGGWTARPASEEAGRIAWHGQVMRDDALPNEACADEERIEGLARELCRQLPTPIWKNRSAAELDQQDLASFMRANTRSELGHFWVNSKYRSDEGDDLDQIGLLGWLAGFQLYANRTGGEMCAYHLPCSSQELCTWMLSSLEAVPSFGSALQGIRQARNGVTLFFRRGAVEVDRVVLTLPPRCLERLSFDAPLEARRRRAIEACRMGRAVKIAWQFDRPWWREEGWSGNLLADNSLQTIWDASIGATPVLCAYVCGQDAVAWQRQQDPVQTSLQLLAELCPAASKTFVRGWFHDWIRDPFAKGVYSHLQPGFVLNHLPFMAAPSDRIHFAGEHTAAWSGFMEGALESAERVVDEILCRG
jgi:monoamine oxidase